MPPKKMDFKVADLENDVVVLKTMFQATQIKADENQVPLIELLAKALVKS